MLKSLFSLRWRGIHGLHHFQTRNSIGFCWLSHRDPEIPAPNASRDVFTKPLVTKASISRVRLKACEGDFCRRNGICLWSRWGDGRKDENASQLSKFIKVGECSIARSGTNETRNTYCKPVDWILDGWLKSRVNQVSNWPDFWRVSKPSACKFPQGCVWKSWTFIFFDASFMLILMLLGGTPENQHSNPETQGIKEASFVVKALVGDGVVDAPSPYGPYGKHRKT